jgi:hypothetical protein
MIKEQDLSFLYDLSGFYEIDSNPEKVVITSKIDDITDDGTLSSRRITLSGIITDKLKGTIKTGDIILVANEDMTKKLYCLITIACGQVVPFVIYEVDLNTGNEVIADFLKGDVDLLMEYPMFNDIDEIVFFLSNLNRVFSDNASVEDRTLIQPIKEYLDKGLWAAYIDGMYDSPDEITSRLGLTKVGESVSAILPDLAISMTPVPIYEKDGKFVAFYDYNVYGDYNLVKAIFCEVVKAPEAKAFLYNNAFGSLFSKAILGNVMKNLVAFENDIKIIKAPKPTTKTEEQITKEIIQQQAEVMPAPVDAWANVEDVFQEGLKESKTKRKKKREKSFEVQAEISQQEKEIAIKETIMEQPKSIVIPKFKKINVAAADKGLESITNAPSESYPADWDYVYTIEETSKRYNKTVGQKYLQEKDEFVLDPEQKKGMTIEDWNAYFIAHPELSHLIQPAIGHLGGLSITQESLIESGHLIYNIKSDKFVYIHEYVVGNIYKFIDDYDAFKDAIINKIGQIAYDKQMEILLSKRPEVKRIDEILPEKKPFIHPLDEIIVDYKINEAAEVIYYNNDNNALMRAKKKSLEAQVKAGTIKRNDYDTELQEYGNRVQSLSIVIFFKEWLKDQVGKLAAYGLSDIQMANDLYFGTMSYNSFARDMVERGLVQMAPNHKTFTDAVSQSDFFEAKDSAKRFVNDLFQEFLLTQTREDDRAKIEYKWNARYNGYVEPDPWKLPIFIRHSKWFKARSKKNFLKLDEVQISGIKFATIGNSSIIAHEVGYGKTLVAIGYMSHCFETGTARNILVTVPKTLYTNRKWKEEIIGSDDLKKHGDYLVGATPQYNLIELGNFSTSSIWSNGNSQFKDYSEDDIDKINRIAQLFTEIGGREAEKQKSKSIGTATLPTNAYNFRKSVSMSNFSWSKLIDKILPGLDKSLFYRSVGLSFEEKKRIIDLLAGYTFRPNAADKQTDLHNLVQEIIKIRWIDRFHNPSFPGTPFTGFSTYNEALIKTYDAFYEKELPNRYEKDKAGKIIWVKDTQAPTGESKKLRPLKAVYEEYILEVLEDLHKWLEMTLQKMKDFAIYEYGKWKFNSSTNNIILSTKEALGEIGFSRSHLDAVTDVVKEITTYENEEAFDIDKEYEVSVVDTVTGEKKSYKRKPEVVLQKQLQDLVSKIETNLTEAGPRGKFFLENLKIDGFILDEAHIAKKVFTNVKTDASIRLDDYEGKRLTIKTTSHDIKGGQAPTQALAVFGICQYIKSLNRKQPLMLLTATPFSNQPTEIFSMLSLVGISQLREYGISNIKNFFDLFLKETLKFDFDHNGDFIKRISVEDFRNKEMLISLIQSVIDIRREASLDKKADPNDKSRKPEKKIFPRLTDDAFKNDGIKSTQENEQAQLQDVNTVALVNRLTTNTCSIVDQNDVQRKMLKDIENVTSGVINPKTQLEYTFDDVCPNALLFNEIEKEKEKGDSVKSDEEEERQSVVVALRTILNTNIKGIPNGLNVRTQQEADNAMPGMKYGDLIFVANPGDKWVIYKKVSKKGSRSSAGYDALERVTDEDRINDTLKLLSRKNEYGSTFKALGMARGIALTPYTYTCNDLPDPTPENLIKFSPKIEYLVKALKSVKDHHIIEVPKKIKILQDEQKELASKSKMNAEDNARYIQIGIDLAQLEMAREVSGQVVYTNMIRFNYYYRDSSGKATYKRMNIAHLIKEYLVNKGWFTDDEVQLVSSDTSDAAKEQYIKDFQNGKIKVLFGTPAIKEGVDLQHKASTMYIMTPDWNPTDMRQVEGRIWRRDNENKYVRIVYVLLDQSVEIFIYSKLEEKARRLQKIMRERNTIEELEIKEMSLDPNQTKVALASDPEKRADIVTKLSREILIDKRKKANKSREELNRITANLPAVYQNIDIIADQYLMPYIDAYPEYLKKDAEYRLKQIVELYLTNKDDFYLRFMSSINTYPGAISTKMMLADHTFDLAARWEDERNYVSVREFATWAGPSYVSINGLQDIINGFEAGIENRDAIISMTTNTNITIDIVNQILPMRHSNKVSENYNIDDRLVTRFTETSYTRLFKLSTVIFAYTDEMRDLLLKMLKRIKEKQKTATVSQEEIKEEFISIAPILLGMVEEYAKTSPFVKPENYVPYIKAREDKNAKPQFTKVDFETMDLLKKVSEIAYVYRAIERLFSAFSSMNVDRQRDVINKKNKATLEVELLADLGLASDDKSTLYESRKAFVDLFTPVVNSFSLLRDIESTFLKTRNYTLNDIPKLVEEENSKYDALTKEIEDLEAERIMLIEKFKKISKEREDVSIDKIVAKFALSNSLLECKLI